MHLATISVSAWTGIDIQRGVNQVQLLVMVEAVNDVVRLHRNVHSDTSRQGINLEEVRPAPRVDVPLLLHAFNGIPVQRPFQLVILVEDQDIRVTLPVPVQALAFKFNHAAVP
jgi:hypothetical protein